MVDILCLKQIPSEENGVGEWVGAKVKSKECGHSSTAKRIKVI